MNQFLKRYSFLVIAQTFCLALGLWLEHRFVNALSDSNSLAGIVTESGNTTRTVVSEKALTKTSKDVSSSPQPAKNELPVLAIRITVVSWIAAIQAVIAYLILMREQEEAARRHQQVENVSLQNYNELLRTRDAVIFGLARLAESRDPDTGNHLERIAIYSTRLASAARLDPYYRDQITPAFVKLIGISSALHDIGKVGVCDAVLLKPGKLEHEEQLIIQLHAAIGGKCIHEIESRLGRSNFLKMAREIAFGHHEHWDGSGYPKGLAGEEIPLAARIVAIADVYDALYTKRIYKDAYSHKKCVELIRAGAGKQFDPGLVNIFLKLEAEFHEIAQSFHDTTEKAPPVPATDEQIAALAVEEETSLDNKFDTIETLLDQCAGNRPATDAACEKMLYVREENTLVGQDVNPPKSDQIPADWHSVSQPQ